jgi:hypothetical protein
VLPDLGAVLQMLRERSSLLRGTGE